MTEFRNVAIIAHVDHGKTTLVDHLLRQAGTFAEHQAMVDRVMDSMDLERERGITILSKHTSLRYKGIKVNVVDTPGHADFGGEVERILKTVDGVLLLVDAAEGPMPQTRFVLRKALEAGLRPVVVINKMDRSDARPAEVLDEVYDLFIDLGADDNQIEFPVAYAIARDGVASLSPDEKGEDLKPIFDIMIEHLPPPKRSLEGAMQMLITSLDRDNYVGRLVVGRIARGVLKAGMDVVIDTQKGEQKGKVSSVWTFEGLTRTQVEEAEAGDIVAVAGLTDAAIGDTICDPEQIEALPRVRVDEPTIAVNFLVNDSAFAGKEGKYVTSRQILARLKKEAQANVSIRIEETQSADTFKILGRGVLQLSIIIETMRREGFEFCVSKPEVIAQEIDGVLHEPMEEVYMDLPEEFLGVVTQRMAARKGRMRQLHHGQDGRVRAEFLVPSRGLVGFRGEFVNDTRGQGVLNTLFHSYAPWMGDIRYRNNGAIVADREGPATGYALFHLQPRGRLFIGPPTKVYEGMIIGENAKANDLDVNVIRGKKLTNVRSAGNDENIRLTPHVKMNLEQAIAWLDEDELVEVTPESLRLRKRILSKAHRPKRKSKQ